MKVGVVGGKSSILSYQTPRDLEKMEIYQITTQSWILQNQPLPVIRDKAIWDSTFGVVNDRLTLLGGQGLNSGPTNKAFVYDEVKGFRILNQGLQVSRSDHVAVRIGEMPTIDSKAQINFK